jgi:hypothetical protein
MTAYQLIQRLAKFPPDTKVRNGVDWSDVVLDDATDTTGEDGPCLVLTTAYSSNGHAVDALGYQSVVHSAMGASS